MVVSSSASSGVSRTAHLHPQLELFSPQAVAGPEPTIQLQKACQCGCSVATVGAGAGPHAASLRCRSCGRHRDWLSRAHCAYINRVLETRGVPRDPIVLPTVHRPKPVPNDTGLINVVHIEED